MCDTTHPYDTQAHHDEGSWRRSGAQGRRQVFWFPCLWRCAVTYLIWLIHMTNSYVWRASLTHMCDMTHSHVWHDSLIYMIWLIHMHDMTRSYVWHASLKCVTWLTHTCEMTYSYTWYDSFTCTTWLIHMCDMTHSYVWHDSLIYVIWLISMHDMTHSYMCDMSHSYITPSISISLPLEVHHDLRDMWWLRLVGSLNLQASFAKEPYKRDYILQKRAMILWSLLIVATPYDSFTWTTWLIHLCDMTHSYVTPSISIFLPVEVSHDLPE